MTSLQGPPKIFIFLFFSENYPYDTSIQRICNRDFIFKHIGIKKLNYGPYDVITRTPKIFIFLFFIENYLYDT